ncbi:MAG: ankyrin repeat domain-containing protein [Micavibrio sp.]
MKLSRKNNIQSSLTATASAIVLAFACASVPAQANALPGTAASIEKSGLAVTDKIALSAAAASGNLEEIKKLIARGVHPDIGNGAALTAAADNGQLEAVRLLLDLKANINIDDGWPLVMAADRGNVAIVQLFLERGIDPYLDGIQAFLGHMTKISKDPNFSSTRYSSPEHAKILEMIGERRRALEQLQSPVKPQKSSFQTPNLP